MSKGPLVLLLKTRSSPTDAYEDYFASKGSLDGEPRFVPVLQHRFNEESISWLHSAIKDGAFRDHGGSASYGGLIFTSQRAVEAFAKVVESLQDSERSTCLPGYLPLYVVGPATEKAVRSIGLDCPVKGAETGNGDALARYILQDYTRDRIDLGTRRLPLLFLVGEQRRDIIPKTLQSEGLPSEQRIPVVERTVYETAEREGFATDFKHTLDETPSRSIWVVVFSPQGCRAMLTTLGWLDADEKYNAQFAACGDGRVRVATIGPTTRDYLVRNFDFDPHVCAETPNPEGVGGGIQRFLDSIQ